MSKSLDFNFLESQWEALTSPAREVLFGGARGGGKSVLLRYASILFAMYVPGLTVYLFRKKYGDLYQNHIYGPLGYLNLLKPFIDAGTVKITMTPAPRIEFYHGKNKPPSMILLRHCQFDMDVENYRGAEIHLLLLDEATHFSKFVIDALRRCLRVGSHKIDYSNIRKVLPFLDDGFFPKAIYATNSGGESHNFFRRGFVKAAPPRTVFQGPEQDGGMSRIFIPSLVSDNRFLQEEDPEYETRLHSGTKAEIRMNLYGDWDVVSGGCFEDVWEEKIHLLEPFSIPSTWYVDRSYDYGSSKPFAVIYTAESDGSVIPMADGSKRAFPRGTLFIIGEIYGWTGEENVGSRLSATEVGRIIADYECQKPWGDLVRAGPGDWQIFEKNRGGQEETIHDLYIDGFNAIVKEYRNTQKGSKRKFRGTSNLFFEADKAPGSRVKGLGILRTYLKNSMQSPMEERGLFVFNTATQTIRTLPVLSYDSTKFEDVDTHSEDHIYDAIRYRVQTTPKRYSNMGLKGV